ncbi:MAG TPA: N-6 DNA methylase [Methanotrichaceae archaeon]|nr:N-6 DNA methylase [Methanotrichaceae archaeon]
MGVSPNVSVLSGGRTERVWFYDMEKDGYSLDDKRNFIDGKGDIPDIIERYKKRREEKPTDRKGKCFFVPYGEIKENGYDLSISKYKEIEYEEVQYEKPEIILNKIEELEDQIKVNIAELRKLLGQQ